MRAAFRAPRRRPRVRLQYQAALPVNLEERSVFRAQLVNQHILVCEPGHCQEIYSKGFFGKGVLSRAGPDHSLSERWEEHQGSFLPVVSQSRYEQLLCQAGAALSAQGLDSEAVSQTLLRLSQPVQELRKGAGPEPEGGACAHLPLQSSEVGPEAKRARRSDLNPDPTQDLSSDSEPDQDVTCDPGSEPDPEPLVPGPGFVLVESDSQVGREVRRTPQHFTEYLQLSLEEAFFLVYTVGCLSVSQFQEPLSIIQLWRKFCSMQPDFVSSFAAYQFLRSRGWVPKGGGGAKYGADLTLYRKGPPFYHASYSVVVLKVCDAFKDSALRPFSWRSLAALSRITANVSKELMLCYVIYPADLSDAELDSPVCLQRLKVQEVIVSRWVSSRERAEQDDV
ncbi:tRNA-splicing endonuclease subunit Sen2 [Genypterus blacodes]|uniref:tRNA-splicing endonuclease subunit Sen2 n=1 Tax=Genypterus blacodes TaxID=154954 RepID=UPI003F763CD9